MPEPDVSNTYRLFTMLLLKSGPQHGYGLIKQLETVAGKKPSTSQIYPFLDRLREGGYVSVREQEDRKVYRLTDDGHQFVEERLDSFGDILEAALEDAITECSHCTCTIYGDGYTENGKMYCCSHCAAADE